jgi:hypothetical protein
LKIQAGGARVVRLWGVVMGRLELMLRRAVMVRRREVFIFGVVWWLVVVVVVGVVVVVVVVVVGEDWSLSRWDDGLVGV